MISAATAILLGLAATAPAPQAAQNTPAKVLTEICLPLIEARAAAGSLDAAVAAAEGLGFTGEAGGDGWNMQTDGGEFLLRLNAEAETEDARADCVLQARSRNLREVLAVVRRPADAAGFTRDPEWSDDYPAWFRDQDAIALSQREGRATVMRVDYSSLRAPL